MSAELADRPAAADGAPGGSRLGRILGVVLTIGLAVLLVEIMLEAWIQELLGNRSIDTTKDVLTFLGAVPGWPKDLKNGLIIALVVIGSIKITVERRWREFTTAADAALVVLVLIMVAAGVVNDSPPTLIVEALFVYFRGAVVFYAVRALAPTWRSFRPVLWAGGVVLAISTVVAFVQLAVGTPAYEAVGWVDLQYALIDRAHGLFDHPNHLGHVLAMVALGLVAWMTGMPRPSWRWWVGLGLVAIGLAASQSRESWLATLVGVAVIWFLRRQGGRVAVLAIVLISVFFLGHLFARPENLSVLGARLSGLVNAVETPSGTEDCEGYETNDECIKAGKVQPRESRALFYQQGADLLAQRPLLGYGVGHFGGIVAETNDPNWEKHPRWGPGGFDLHDYDGTTVDSYWLHLAVEVGLLGLLAFLTWLALITWPLVRATRRYARRAAKDAAKSTARRPVYTAASAAHPAVYWAVAAMIFAVLVAFLSPALEDPLFPMILFGIMGLGWVMNRREANPVTTGPVPGERPAPMA
jgi:O-antigen ligase